MGELFFFSFFLNSAEYLEHRGARRARPLKQLAFADLTRTTRQRQWLYFDSRREPIPKTKVRLHCYRRGGGRVCAGGATAAGKNKSCLPNHPPVSVLANNDHCPANMQPLEMISGHKSLAFHFKPPPHHCPPAGGQEFQGWVGHRTRLKLVVHWSIVRRRCVLLGHFGHFGWHVEILI